MYLTVLYSILSVRQRDTAPSSQVQQVPHREQTTARTFRYHVLLKRTFFADVL